ncbi:MAG TPA: hypothetical protein VER08_05605 [Pyrinomonadaceae bacterium]|nr:hypothetical protein [Pyrinomonadaceae bacterium]
MRATTADGHTLQVPDASLPALLPHLRRAGLSALTNAAREAGPHRTAARAFARLAASAQRSGTARHVETGRPYPVFSASLAGRNVRLVARPLGPARSALVAVRPGRPSSAETETGPGAADVHVAIFRHLQSHGLQDAGDGNNRRLPPSQQVRWGMQQLNAAGRRVRPPGGGLNKPDISYLDPRGRRVNVEIDTNPGSMNEHIRKNVAADPNAVHVFLHVDRSGRVLERRIIAPNANRSHVRRFPGGVPVNQIIGQLPLPAGHQQRQRLPQLRAEARQRRQQQQGQQRPPQPPRPRRTAPPAPRPAPARS